VGYEEYHSIMPSNWSREFHLMRGVSQVLSYYRRVFTVRIALTGQDIMKDMERNSGRMTML